MASTASSAPSITARGKSGRAERRFFTGYMLAIAALLILGFAPTFYLRGIAPPYHPLKPLRPEVLFHGLLASAFVLVFPLQTGLIAVGKRALHVQLGKWGFLLGAAMLPLLYVVGITSYHAAAANGSAAPPIVAALAVPTIPVLALLLGVAWRSRYDAQSHKRWMVVIGCLLTDPAFNRLPLWEASFTGFVASEIATLATLAPLWVWDLFTRGKPHVATVLGSAAFFLLLAARTLAAPTPEWAGFLAMLPGFGPP